VKGERFVNGEWMLNERKNGKVERFRDCSGTIIINVSEQFTTYTMEKILQPQHLISLIVPEGYQVSWLVIFLQIN
jgi:DNA polymerase/3'-5' exonuclease PolX